MKSLDLAYYIAVACAFALVITGHFFAAALAVMTMLMIFNERKF